MRSSERNGWAWVPTLYVAEGVPYAAVMTVSVVMYKTLGVSNPEIAFYTSWLYLPWVIKPFWSALVELFLTKRFWIIAMQLLIGASFACIALTLRADSFFKYTLAFFWIMAFSSATHDIAADGFYMLGLSEPIQSALIGVRTTFYRLAMIVAQGGLVVLAGCLESRTGSVVNSWSISLLVAAVLFLSLSIYHLLVLPRPGSDRPAGHGAGPVAGRAVIRESLQIYAQFFKKPGIMAIIGFFLFYRFAEAQLVKLIAPFLLDSRAQGGLGLSTSQVGVIYGTFGVIALIAGGLFGGYAIYRKGLRWWLWIMVFSMHLPDLVFVYLSRIQPDNLFLIGSGIALEQFGYGFGFTAYTMFMILVSGGEYKTVYFAIATGIMAVGMMIPGMFSGWIQEQIGYQNFFVWIIISTIPGFIFPALVRIDPEFGKAA